MTPRFDDSPARDEFRALEGVLSQSAAARAERALRRRIGSAFAHSRSRDAGRRLIASFRALPAAAQVRLSGCALLAFVVLHVAWRFAMPIGTAPATPMAAWMWLALVAATLVIAPESLARAWRRHRGLPPR